MQTGFKNKDVQFDDVAQLEKTFNVLSVKGSRFVIDCHFHQRNQYVIEVITVKGL